MVHHPPAGSSDAHCNSTAGILPFMLVKRSSKYVSILSSHLRIQACSRRDMISVLSSPCSIPVLEAYYLMKSSEVWSWPETLLAPKADAIWFENAGQLSVNLWYAHARLSNP